MSKRSAAFAHVTHYQVDIQYIGSRLGTIATWYKHTAE